MSVSLPQSSSSHSKSSPSLLLCPDSPNAGESDADSGIVAAINGQRIGSTSSNSDEDHNGHERGASLSASSLPNRNRVQPMNFHRVRFDDELHLSEHNMRRSCRKLFATLYMPSHSPSLEKNEHHTIIKQSLSQSNNSNIVKSDYSVPNCSRSNAHPTCSLLPECHCHQFSQTLPHKSKLQRQQQYNPKSRPITGISGQRINSDINLNVEAEPTLAQRYNGLLLQTVPQTEDLKIKKVYSECNANDQYEVKQMKLLEPSRIKSKSCWSIDNRDFVVSCAALDKISTMTDTFESASMVRAFAKPIVIKTKDYDRLRIIEEPIYETIYPKDKSVNETNILPEDTKHIKCDANDLIENNTFLNHESKENITLTMDGPRSDNIIKSDPSKYDKRNNTADISYVNKYKLSYLSSPSLTQIPQNERSHPFELSLNQINQKSILRNSQKVNPENISSKHGLSPDEIYPTGNDADDEDDHLSSEEDGKEIVKYATVNKQRKKQKKESEEKFSYSYSAGDIRSKHSVRPLSTRSELNLHEFGQTIETDNRVKKSLFQRFRTAFSRVFTNERNLSAQKDYTRESKLSINGIECRSKNDLNANDTIALNKSPSFVKSIRTRMSFRKSVKINVEKHTPEKRLRWKDQSSSPESPPMNAATVWGELIKLNSNGSQMVQIHRQKGFPFGFFVARGTVNNVKGVFISRMRDEEIQKSLLGVLEIGDEILSIDGESVKESNIMHVNELIANKDRIILTVVPYVNSHKHI